MPWSSSVSKSLIEAFEVLNVPHKGDDCGDLIICDRGRRGHVIEFPVMSLDPIFDSGSESEVGVVIWLVDD